MRLHKVKGGFRTESGTRNRASANFCGLSARHVLRVEHQTCEIIRFAVSTVSCAVCRSSQWRCSRGVEGGRHGSAGCCRWSVARLAPEGGRRGECRHPPASLIGTQLNLEVEPEGGARHAGRRAWGGCLGRSQTHRLASRNRFTCGRLCRGQSEPFWLCPHGLLRKHQEQGAEPPGVSRKMARVLEAHFVGSTPLFSVRFFPCSRIRSPPPMPSPASTSIGPSRGICSTVRQAASASDSGKNGPPGSECR